MRAERDEDEYVPSRTIRKEPRLAYEIALGIIIAGVVLMAIDAIGTYIAAKIMLNQVQIRFPG